MKALATAAAAFVGRKEVKEGGESLAAWAGHRENMWKRKR
jgi:hypothetical protein